MRGVIKEFKNKLLFGILVVLVLLLFCMTVDYADNTTIDNMNYTPKESNVTKVTMVDNVSVVGVNDSDSHFVAKNSDKIYTIKEKTKEKVKNPTITMAGKPSCGCRYSYTWHTRTYLNYCPICHHWNCLTNKHKYQARFEQEITCRNCDSDFCICCGKNKYSWSRVYLRRG